MSDLKLKLSRIPAFALLLSVTLVHSPGVEGLAAPARKAASAPSTDYYTVQMEQGRKLRYRKTEEGYVLVLTPGQRIISSLKEFQKLMNFESASVTGIGAVRNARIGHFNFEKNAHEETTFAESHELVSLNCTLGRFDGISAEPPAEENTPHPHCHIAIGLGKDEGHRMVGGHLNEAEISILGELFVATTPAALKRTYDRPFNGRLIDLDQLEAIERTDKPEPFVPTKPKAPADLEH